MNERVYVHVQGFPAVSRIRPMLYSLAELNTDLHRPLAVAWAADR
jgi:hypothetical protein